LNEKYKIIIGVKNELVEGRVKMSGLKTLT